MHLLQFLLRDTPFFLRDEREALGACGGRVRLFCVPQRVESGVERLSRVFGGTLVRGATVHLKKAKIWKSKEK
jgi:hypothetical protein